MVELPSNPFDLDAIYDLATSQGFEYWIGLGVNIILSTIIGGIILVIIVELLGKRIGAEPGHPANSFLIVLIINLINFFGVLGIGLPIVSQIGLGGVVLQLLIWIALIKLFFREFSILHAIIIGVIGFFATTYLAGILAVFVAGLLPV